ncbi:MAG: hypothetical protein NZ703_10785, partial [Gemmataceae bacterium]|nr:hypothetical protein [Gemmataceae bacterium]
MTKRVLSRWLGVMKQRWQPVRPIRRWKTDNRRKLQVETLEARVAPAVFTVTSTVDDPFTAGTLRWAITQANNSPDPADVIQLQVGTVYQLTRPNVSGQDNDNLDG